MITKDMLLADVLAIDAAVAPVFLRHGLHCMGCALASGETIEEAASVHNLDLDELMADLHQFFGDEAGAAQ